MKKIVLTMICILFCFAALAEDDIDQELLLISYEYSGVEDALWKATKSETNVHKLSAIDDGTTNEEIGFLFESAAVSTNNGNMEGHEVKDILEDLWENADAFVLDNTESFITVVRRACDIPEDASVEYLLGEKRNISAEEIETKEQRAIDISEKDFVGMPDGLSDFAGNDAYRLTPDYYGIIVYKFVWNEMAPSGEFHLCYKVIEQLYVLNRDPETVDMSPVISYFIELEDDAFSGSNALKALSTQLL